MSSIPRLRSAAAEPRGAFRDVFAHQAPLMEDFYHLYGVLWSHGVLDHGSKEIARLRNARTTGCGF